MTAKKRTEQKQDGGSGANFEKSIERLEKIVGEMESGSLSLEKMIGHFDEGQTLVKFCTDTLNEVEKKIEIMVKRGGATVTEPFDGAESKDDEDDDDLF